MNAPDTESRQVMLTLIESFGVMDAPHAFMEYQWASEYRRMPKDARYLQELVEVDGSLIFVFRNPDELKAL